MRKPKATRRYKTSEVNATIAALEATRVDGGPPVLNAVAKARGIEWRTVRAWWDAHVQANGIVIADTGKPKRGRPASPKATPEPKPAASLHVLPPVKAKAQGPLDEDGVPLAVETVDIIATAPIEYHVWQWGQIAADIAGARDTRTYGALPPLRRLMDEHYGQARALIDAESKRSGRTPSEVLARLKESAAKLQPIQLDVFIAEARKRGQIT